MTESTLPRPFSIEHHTLTFTNHPGTPSPSLTRLQALTIFLDGHFSPLSPRITPIDPSNSSAYTNSQRPSSIRTQCSRPMPFFNVSFSCATALPNPITRFETHNTDAPTSMAIAPYYNPYFHGTITLKPDTDDEALDMNDEPHDRHGQYTPHWRQYRATVHPDRTTLQPTRPSTNPHQTKAHQTLLEDELIDHVIPVSKRKAASDDDYIVITNPTKRRKITYKTVTQINTSTTDPNCQNMPKTRTRGSQGAKKKLLCIASRALDSFSSWTQYHLRGTRGIRVRRERSKGKARGGMKGRF